MGKMVSIAQCKKTFVQFESLLSSCEIANSKQIKVECVGTCNSFQIDKVDGCKVTLSKASMGALFNTASSSEMNIEFPNPDDAEGLDTITQPIPEQFTSTIANL